MVGRLKSSTVASSSRGGGGLRRTKKGTNLSRKQVFEAQQKIWRQKERTMKEEAKAAKREKLAQIQKLKNKSIHHVFDRTTLHAVQGGLTSAIEMLGQKVSSLSLFISAFTALSKAPDQRPVPYMLSIMAACVPQLTQRVLLHQLPACFGLCDQLMAEYGANSTLVVAKALKLAVTVLLTIESPTAEQLRLLEKLEPSKLQTEAMKLYLSSFRKVLETSALCARDVGSPTRRKDSSSAFYSLNTRQRFFCAGLPIFVRVCLRNLTETTTAVMSAVLAELTLLFDRTLSPYIVESQEGQRCLDELLSEELLSLLKPLHQQCWGMTMELLATIFKRMSYLKRVQLPPLEVAKVQAEHAAIVGKSASAAQHSLDRTRTYIAFTDRFPSVPFLVRVLNKLRVMEDASLNAKVERVLVAVGSCMYMREFTELLDFDPRTAYEAEMRTEEDAAEKAAALWSTSYLLNVWRRTSSHDSLPFFIQHFFPLIQFCSKMAVEAEKEKRVEEFTRWSALQAQYWRVAAGFCHYPVEVTLESFRDLAKQLVSLLSSPVFVNTSASAIHVLCSGYNALRRTEQDDDDDDDLDDTEVLPDDLRGEVPTSKAVQRQQHRLRKDALDEDLYILSVTDPGWNPHRYHNITQAYSQLVCDTILSRFSANIMPKLCNTFEKHDSTAVLLAIQSFSTVCNTNVMTTILEGILSVSSNIAAQTARNDGSSSSGTSKAGNVPLNSKRRVILDIACAVVPQLSSEHVMTLFRDLIEPILMDPTPESRLLQKKAYKLLYAMFEHRIKDIFPVLQRILGLLSISRQHVTISGLKMRIRCLSWALDACKMYYPAELLATIRSLVGEVVLFSRERSSETRAMTMDVLEKMQRYMTAAGAPVNALLLMVIAGLSGKTPMMVSSTVVCMAKVVYLTHNELPEADLQAAMAVGFQLMESKEVEVRTAAAIFARMALKLTKRSPAVKAAVAKSLPKLLYAIALVTSQPSVSSNARMQLRVLLEKCLKRFPIEQIDPIFPLGSKNFLRYTQKMMKREEKKSEKELKKRKEKQQNEFDKLFIGAAMNAGREDAAEEDLLETGALSSFVAKHTAPVFQGFGSATITVGGDMDDKDDEYDNVVLDFQSDGKLRIISKEEKRVEEAHRARQEMAERLLRRSKGLVNASALNDEASARPGKRSRAEDEDFTNEELTLRYGSRVTEDAAQKATKVYRGGRGSVGPSALQVARLRDQKAAKREIKRQRVEEDIRKGDEFRGTGDGDVKRGNIDPFAYVPLNRRYMNRRNARHAVHRFKAVTNKHLKGHKAKAAKEVRGK
ncbi:NUC173 domain containing protein, putative [Leishmania lindenbergi]|uniref:NUC173 domain containing protein n=1 Tax=Leishmania lindenbergi TaxID=651832 RepID=A0AAW3A0C0_9TRYP